MPKKTRVLLVPGLPSLSVGDPVFHNYPIGHGAGKVVCLHPGREFNVSVAWHNGESANYTYNTETQEITRTQHYPFSH